MAKINVPPTRSNLLRVKQDLNFAREGYEILNRKREVLTSELIKVAHEAEMLQQEVWKNLEAAYRAMENAQLRMGARTRGMGRAGRQQNRGCDLEVPRDYGRADPGGGSARRAARNAL